MANQIYSKCLKMITRPLCPVFAVIRILAALITKVVVGDVAFVGMLISLE
jgi:hypothetical protein